MKNVVYLMIALGFMSSTAYAADAAKGKASSVACAGCHSGTSPGISAVDTFPNLAGQKQGYLVKQLKAFKSGERKDATMTAMVASLSDSDIDNIASYFSSLKN